MQFKIINSKMASSKQRNIENESIQKFKEIHYPLQPFQPAVEIVKNETNIELLNKIVKSKLSINAIRKVRGDGNCLVRAFAFEFFVNLHSTSFQICFPDLENIKLTSCDIKHIPKQFHPFYEDNFLKIALKLHFSKCYDQYLMNNNYQRAFSNLCNYENWVDFIIILYFRQKIALYYQKNVSYYANFAQENQLCEIRQYGCESDGIIRHICINLLKFDLVVYEIKASNKIIVYKQFVSDSKATIYLLFQNKHYDLLQYVSCIQQEAQDKVSSKNEFFSQLSIRMVNGQCLQCQKRTNINHRTGLCERCYMISVKQLQTFKSFKSNAKVSQNTINVYKSPEKIIQGRKCIECNGDKIKNQVFCKSCQNKQEIFSNTQENDTKKSFYKNKIEKILDCGLQNLSNIKEKAKRLQSLEKNRSKSKNNIKNKLNKEFYQKGSQTTYSTPVIPNFNFKNKMTKSEHQNIVIISRDNIKQTEQHQARYNKKEDNKLDNNIYITYNDSIISMSLSQSSKFQQNENCLKCIQISQKKNHGRRYCYDCDLKTKNISRSSTKCLKGPDYFKKL